MGNLLFHHLLRLLRHKNPEVLLVRGLNNPLGLISKGPDGFVSPNLIPRVPLLLVLVEIRSDFLEDMTVLLI
jgi:hypothetical protein